MTVFCLNNLDDPLLLLNALILANDLKSELYFVVSFKLFDIKDKNN